MAIETIPTSLDHGNRGESKIQVDTKSPGHKLITATEKAPSNPSNGVFGRFADSSTKAALML